MNYRVAGIVVVVLLVLGLVSTRVASLRSSVLDPAEIDASEPTQDYEAPDFEGIDRWINSEPLSIEALAGKVVLVDFWTYSCINCIRTLPHLRSLYERYADDGLEIIGVHSPEFEFEKVPQNVIEAVDEYDVTWPVAMDNDMITWAAYANNYWPHVYVIDREGHVRFDFIGEGHDAEIDAAVEALLNVEAEGDGGEVARGGPSGPTTPEIYIGPERGTSQGFLGNSEGYRDGVFRYQAPGLDELQETSPSGPFFLEGAWEAERESLTAVSAGAAILLRFHARDVYIVAGSDGSDPGQMRVLLDGKPVTAGAGGDVRAGTLTIGGHDLYHVLHLPTASTHLLQLVVTRPAVSAFTFTFG